VEMSLCPAEFFDMLWTPPKCGRQWDNGVD